MSDVGDWRSWPKQHPMQKIRRDDPEFSLMVETWARHPVTRAVVSMLEGTQEVVLWDLIGSSSRSNIEDVRSIAARLDLLGALVDFLKEPLEKAKKE